MRWHHNYAQIFSPRLWDAVPHRPRKGRAQPLSNTARAALELIATIACALAGIALILALGIAYR